MCILCSHLNFIYFFSIFLYLFFYFINRQQNIRFELILLYYVKLFVRMPVTNLKINYTATLMKYSALFFRIKNKCKYNAAVIFSEQDY